MNGTGACANPDLMQRDLKQRMGFQGFVMSDWDAADETSVTKGLDMCMPMVKQGVRREGSTWTCVRF